MTKVHFLTNFKLTNGHFWYRIVLNSGMTIGHFLKMR